MTWTFDPSKGKEPIEGLPLEADDKTFDAAVAAYEAQFDDPKAKGSVKLSGLYIQSKANDAPEKET